MNINTISEQVRAFVIENYLFGTDEGLKESDSFLETGIIDSTGMLELIAYLERNFNLKVDTTELVPENLDSILNVSAFVQRKLYQHAEAAVSVRPGPESEAE